MRKILFTFLTISGVSAFAIDQTAFQQFDNQYNLGYSMSQMQLSNGAAYQTLQQSQYLNLQVERLFDAGVWLNVDGTFMLSTNSLGNQATGTGQGSGMMTQNPIFNGLNAKVGYAFPIVSQHVLLTPYALAGWNNNWSASAMQSASPSQNISQDFFYTGGIGARLEFRVNNWLDLYADQNGTYNWDQSGPQGGIQPQNMMVFTSTLGAKFNVVKNLQLGINGFYNNYQYAAAAPGTLAVNGGASGSGQILTVYQPQYTVGGMVTVGLTY